VTGGSADRWQPRCCAARCLPVVCRWGEAVRLPPSCLLLLAPLSSCQSALPVNFQFYPRAQHWQQCFRPNTEPATSACTWQGPFPGDEMPPSPLSGRAACTLVLHPHPPRTSRLRWRCLRPAGSCPAASLCPGCCYLAQMPLHDAERYPQVAVPPHAVLPMGALVQVGVG